MRNNKLYIELNEKDEITADDQEAAYADGVVLDQACAQKWNRDTCAVAALRVGVDSKPDSVATAGCQVWVCDGGIEETARLRDEQPEATWIPRIEIIRPDVRYSFQNTAAGEGFKYYVPDTAALQRYSVANSSADLEKSLARAAELAFLAVWLHSIDAERSAKGFELDMVERARLFYNGILWVSGGATTLNHVRCLGRADPRACAVVPLQFARIYGMQQVKAALVGSESALAGDAAIEAESESA